MAASFNNTIESFVVPPRHDISTTGSIYTPSISPKNASSQSMDVIIYASLVAGVICTVCLMAMWTGYKMWKTKTHAKKMQRDHFHAISKFKMQDSHLTIYTSGTVADMKHETTGDEHNDHIHMHCGDNGVAELHHLNNEASGNVACSRNSSQDEYYPRIFSPPWHNV